MTYITATWAQVSQILSRAPDRGNDEKATDDERQGEKGEGLYHNLRLKSVFSLLIPLRRMLLSVLYVNNRHVSSSTAFSPPPPHHSLSAIECSFAVFTIYVLAIS